VIEPEPSAWYVYDRAAAMAVAPDRQVGPDVDVAAVVVELDADVDSVFVDSVFVSGFVDSVFVEWLVDSDALVDVEAVDSTALAPGASAKKAAATSPTVPAAAVARWGEFVFKVSS
jgi:hypothetical protein